MATKLPDPKVSVRLRDDDQRIASRLIKKLGVDMSQILRLGIRALAEKEKVAV